MISVMACGFKILNSICICNICRKIIYIRRMCIGKLLTNVMAFMTPLNQDAYKCLEYGPVILGDKGAKEEFDGSLSKRRCFVLVSLWKIEDRKPDEKLFVVYSRWVSKCKKYVAVIIFSVLSNAHKTIS